MSSDDSKSTTNEAAVLRRTMLMRLGLAATVAYAAPVMLNLGEARASSFSGSRGSRSFSGRGRRSRRRGGSFS